MASRKLKQCGLVFIKEYPVAGGIVGIIAGYGYGLQGAAIGGKTEADGSNAGGDEERAVEAGAASEGAPADGVTPSGIVSEPVKPKQ